MVCTSPLDSASPVLRYGSAGRRVVCCYLPHRPLLRLMYSILPTINRDWILSKISQEQIMERYVGVGIKINEKFKSPFREDNSPSCVYYYNKAGKLFFRDFGKGRPMDAFEVACQVNDCDFTEVLKVITEDFNLLHGSPVKKDYSHLEIARRIAAEPTNISIEPYTVNGQWSLDKAGLDFWQRNGISPATLMKYRVFQLNQAWVNDKVVYRYLATSPGFAYWMGDEDYKLYFPLKDKVRFMQNTDVVQGEAQLPADGPLLVITKSMKDVMLFHEFGVAACAPQSEVHPVTDEQMEDWKRRFARVVVVYDKDYTGVKNANKLRKQYGLEYAFVEGAKDLSDLYKLDPLAAARWIIKLQDGR